MLINAANMEPIIFVIDDDAEARRAVAEMVHSFGHCAQTFESAQQFLNRLDELEIDQVGCMVVDLRAPTLEGLEIHRRLVERGFALPTIIVTAAADTSLTVKAIRAGALAVLDKPYREHELWSFIQKGITLSEEEGRRRSYQRELEARFKRLSLQDRQVLQLILEGCKNRTMAKHLEVSLRTVENRRKRVFDVMQAESVAQLTRMVMEYEYKLASSAGALETWMALPFEQVV